jgi:hypothetical protein
VDSPRARHATCPFFDVPDVAARDARGVLQPGRSWQTVHERYYAGRRSGERESLAIRIGQTSSERRNSQVVV